MVEALQLMTPLLFGFDSLFLLGLLLTLGFPSLLRPSFLQGLTNHLGKQRKRMNLTSKEVLMGDDPRHGPKDVGETEALVFQI